MKRAPHNVAMQTTSFQRRVRVADHRTRSRFSVSSDQRFRARSRRSVSLSLPFGTPPSSAQSFQLTADYKLALILHPDSSHPAASAEHFATLNKAYKLLSDPAQRRSFLQTGYGWASKAGGDGVSAYDQAFHDAVQHAKQAGASEWRGRGFRDAEAGSGAWTYARYAEFARASEGMGQGMAGEWAKSHGYYDHRRYGSNWQAGAHTQGGWHPYMADGNAQQGTGEPIYMSNLRFFALIAAFSGIFAFSQMFRATKSAESHKELLRDKHAQ